MLRVCYRIGTHRRCLQVSDLFLMHQNGGIPKSFTVNLRREETKEIIHSISDFADRERASKVGPLVNKTIRINFLSLVKQDVSRVLFSLNKAFMFRVMTLWNLDVIW